MARCRLLALLATATLLLACSGDDDSSASEDPEDETVADDAPRFCDAYLAFLAEPTEARLADLAGSADGDLRALIESVGADADGGTIGVDSRLDGDARERCQPEWTAGAQGAGNTAAAAEAFRSALSAGDRIGARNIASANAIAVFEPWDALEGDVVLDTVDDGSFTLSIGNGQVATCDVETGVVLACRYR